MLAPIRKKKTTTPINTRLYQIKQPLSPPPLIVPKRRVNKSYEHIGPRYNRYQTRAVEKRVIEKRPPWRVGLAPPRLSVSNSRSQSRSKSPHHVLHKIVDFSTDHSTNRGVINRRNFSINSSLVRL